MELSGRGPEPKTTVVFSVCRTCSTLFTKPLAVTVLFNPALFDTCAMTLCMCVICMCMCVYIYTHIYIYTWLCRYMCICILTIVVYSVCFWALRLLFICLLMLVFFILPKTCLRTYKGTTRKASQLCTSSTNPKGSMYLHSRYLGLRAPI